MAENRLIIVSPMLHVDTVSVVEEVEDSLLRVTGGRSNLALGPLRAVLAARRAGAEVTFVALTEASMTRAVRAVLEPLGVDLELVEVPAACHETRRFEDEGGSIRFRLRETRLPGRADLDLVLDRLARALERGVGLVVVAGDLEGQAEQDFSERVVGRAWGLGARTLLAANGAALVQALHTQPFGAYLRQEELRRVSPPAPGESDTEEAALSRIFEDPVRILLVRRADGTLEAATRDAVENLGAAGDLDQRDLMGALAARLLVNSDDGLRAAREAVQMVVAAAAEARAEERTPETP